MQLQVLVIEDEKPTRDLFLDCLSTEGFEAMGAENGVLGVQLAQEYIPSVVVCDIIMPELNGYGVLSMLRQESATALIPVIFLTAKHSQAEIRLGMQLGADDYLTKPSSVRELLDTISAQIEKRKLLQSCYEAKFRAPDQATEAAVSDREQDSKQSFFPRMGPLRAVFDFIEANYQKPITLTDVAHAVGYSPAYLTSQVGTQTRYTVNRWIIERRMLAARELLLNSDRKIEEIAMMIGYQHACHFSRQFRKYHDHSPQAWRTAQRAQV